MKSFITILAAIAVFNCTGPTGPTGATGPQGGIGEPGKDAENQIEIFKGNITVDSSILNYEPNIYDEPEIFYWDVYLESTARPFVTCHVKIDSVYDVPQWEWFPDRIRIIHSPAITGDFGYIITSIVVPE